MFVFVFVGTLFEFEFSKPAVTPLFALPPQFKALYYLLLINDTKLRFFFINNKIIFTFFFQTFPPCPSYARGEKQRRPPTRALELAGTPFELERSKPAATPISATPPQFKALRTSPLDGLD